MTDRPPRWDDCNGNPCTCPKPDLPPRPGGIGWQGPEIQEQTPSGWWVRRTELQTIGATHVELFEPNGNKVAETVLWR